MLRSSRLGTLLVGSRTITEDQLNSALRLQKERECRLGEALIELGVCSEVEVTRALAEQMDLPFVDMRLTPPEPQVLRMIPRDTAVKLGVVPLRNERGRLLVAARNPLDISIDETLRGIVRMPVAVCAAAPAQIEDALSNYERLKWGQSETPAAPRPATAGMGTPYAAPAGVAVGSTARSEAQCMQRLLMLVAEGLKKGARDLYFQPQREGLEVRASIDGVMHPLAQVSAPESTQMAACLRSLMNSLPGRERATGSCELRIDGALRQFSCRSLPVVDGVVFVLRARCDGERQLGLDQLGLVAPMLHSVRRALARRSGLVLVAGQMESGRSTTLAAMVRELSHPSVRVMTVEESVDARIAGAMQVQVDSQRADVNGLKLDVLAHRPDILMIEEVADRPTAEVACRAATTGSLVLAGSHAPHALRALARFADLGVTPYTTATALSGILAQRLVRRVCPDCTAPTVLPPALQQSLVAAFGSLQGLDFRRGRGCDRCAGLGTRGRVGVFEWIEVDEDLRRLISDRAMPSALQEHLRSMGHLPLERDAFLKAGRGLIPYEELQNLPLGVAEGVRALH